MKVPKAMLEIFAIATTPPHAQQIIGERDEQSRKVDTSVQPDHSGKQQKALGERCRVPTGALASKMSH